MGKVNRIKRDNVYINVSRWREISLVNLRKKGGALEPVPPREITKTLSDTYDFVFVHQLPSTGESWIGVKGNTVYLDTGITQTSLCVSS